jgi:hypothetical protein
VGAVVAAVSVYASHGSAGHSENMTLVANYSDGGKYRTGTDMAFWGDLALVGTLDQGTGPNASPPGGFRMLDISDPAAPREVGRFTCWGDQSDVSIWEDIVVLSRPRARRGPTRPPDRLSVASMICARDRAWE